LDIALDADEGTEVGGVFVHLFFETFETEFVAFLKTGAVFVEDKSSFFFLDDKEDANDVTVFDEAAIVLV
jgi:hypothetical protein